MIKGPRMRQMFLDKLASILGIDETKLDQSFKEAAKDTVDEALQTGYLTPAQAQRIKTRIEEGKPGLFGRPWNVVARMHQRVEAVFEALASRLGMSAKELESELAGDKSLIDIAQSKGVSEDELRQTVVSALKPRLDEAVKSGRITQKLAEAVIQRIEQTPIAPKAA